jgi:23S rRNA (uracil1939-C5)-methyltransferase
MNLKEKLLKSNLSFYNEKKNIGDLQHLVIRTSSYEQKVLVGIIGLKKVSKELMELSKQIAADPLVKGVVYGRKSKASNSIYPDYEELLSGEATLVEKILGVKVNISLLSFFQVNKKCAEKMYSAAFDMAALSKGAKVLDAYSGIGSFAIYLAKQGLFVTGIESFPKAVEDARINALNNGVIIDFIEGEVEKKVNSLANFDAVFINPPRKGVHKDVIDEISRLNPKKIIYTSCDPATLARDIKLFSEQGYSFIKAIPFDLFPQTMHVETVGLMEKSDGL